MNPFKVTGENYHAMFYQCFEGPFLPTYTSDDHANVREALIDLLIADDDNADNAIITTINKIKEIKAKRPEPIIFDQLLDVVKEKSIQNGAMFLKIFIMNIEGPQVARVKVMILEAIKALQADFHKCNATDFKTITQCLSLPTFAPVGLPKVDQSHPTQQPATEKKGYYKEGGKSSAKYYNNDLKYKNRVLQSLNIYSEQAIDAVDKVYPQAGPAIRIRREAMRNDAVAGKLINCKIVLDMNPVTKIAEFTHRSIDKRDGPFSAIIMTMQSLVYNEILNKQIQTKEDMQKFVMAKFRDVTDPRFSGFLTQPILFTTAFTSSEKHNYRNSNSSK